MSSVVRAVRPGEEIRAEIEQTFGFFPPFFEPALPTPQVLENLWQQTLFAYIDNPLSALFKEKLNALLSRFCAAPYCMIVHSAALRPLGMTARQVLTLLETPPPDQASSLRLGSLPAAPPEEAAAPAPGSVLEETLLYCATAVFLEQANAEACQQELSRLLGPDLYSHLAIYLAYIKTCHLWIEAHPEISYEADQRAHDNLGPLLAEEPALSDFFRTYQVRVAGILKERVTQEAVAAERVRSTEAVRASEEKLRLLVNGAKDYAMILLDAEGQVTSWNAGAERILGWSEEEVFGRLADLIFTPEDRAAGVPAQEMIQAAAEGKALDLRWHLRKDGSRFFADGIMECLRGEDGSVHGFVKVLRDATDQTERAERERFLANLAQRAQALTDPDEVIANAVHSVGEFLGADRCIFADIDIEADTCTIHASEYRADPLAASIVGVVSIASFGAFVVAEYAARRAVVVDDVRLDTVRAPEGNLAAYEAINIRAHATVPVVHFDRVVSCMSLHSAAPRHWTPDEVELLRTVVEHTWLMVEVTRQERALVREAEVTSRILESITDAFFTLDRDWTVTRINDQAERSMTKKRDQVLGRNFLEVFPGLIGSTYEREYRRAVAEGVSVSFEEFYPPLDAWLEVRAYPSLDGLSVFYQDVTVRKRAEADRERLLAEQQKRAEREAILNRIGQAIRSASDPEAVQEEAVNLLGEALGADRCYFALYNLERGFVTIARDKHRADLPPIQGVYPFENTAEMFRELYGNSNTSVVQDALTAPLSAQTKAHMELLQLRSRVSVALVEGDGLTATLTAAMADGPRDWTQEEVALVEAVGTQLRTAVEAARIAQRERTIAQQLQDALQPMLPAYITGMSLGSFSQPALNEASVGGDFYDMFALDKEQYALVIGDVSGKGLAAAQQLALIRNSLRTTLYLYRSPAQAVASLNAIVSAHNLLVGFVTAWVGVYDAATGQITYASCGHEPGLIRRVGTQEELAEDLRVEELQTTGPPLGIAQNAEYAELTVTLFSGDALLLYTDGISEAGPSRRELLTTAGLKRILSGLPESAEVQEQAEMLVTKVSGFAGGVFRDDVAVLLAKRQ